MTIINNNNTHIAAIAPPPSTTHPQSWAEMLTFGPKWTYNNNNNNNKRIYIIICNKIKLKSMESGKHGGGTASPSHCDGQPLKEECRQSALS